MLVVYGKVVGNSISYQVALYSGNLTCKYNGYDFTVRAIHYRGYAECSPVPLGYPEINITLIANGRLYETNENISRGNGPIPISIPGK